ncbi:MULTISPECIES: hypothetical protein [unclassified Microcystis]|jgi:hypothetical protein|uniref:hypothetical protein n=1 Tax=unclassified Microcystis TaxID=2643300 RepID=UPI0022C86BB9|nr:MULTISPECIES: hypothetical protein [unclassified Microcystis]MCZ8047923.1 hypothetical protein [Microcystis sp. LE19-41.2A]MCZ8290388.1 hypothetical protein [Microcystis sp. LE19-59.1C]
MTPALATLELNLQTNVSNAQVLPVATRSLREIAHQPKIDCQVPHSLPGRLRLGIPKLAGDTTYSEKLTYRKFGLKPRPFRTALSYNGKSDNQAKN